MKNQWNHFLTSVLGQASNHYLWLQSLSYLEYIGYRKMVKALGYDQLMSQSVQTHLSDEIEHSLLFKNQLKQLFSKDTQLKLGAVQKLQSIAENYFQSLDSAVEECVQKKYGDVPFLSYLETSLIIEKRAMQVYPSYQAQLAESSLKQTVLKVIRDEADHLKNLDRTLHQYPLLNQSQSQLTEIESQLFNHFLLEMSELSATPSEQLFEQFDPLS